MHPIQRLTLYMNSVYQPFGLSLVGDHFLAELKKFFWISTFWLSENVCRLKLLSMCWHFRNSLILVPTLVILVQFCSDGAVANIF